MSKPKSPRKRTRPAGKAKPFQAAPPSRLALPGVSVDAPQYAEAKHTPDPTQFLHAVTDAQFYREVDKETVNQLIQSIPPSRDPNNLLLSISGVYGSQAKTRLAAIFNAK